MTVDESIFYWINEKIANYDENLPLNGNFSALVGNDGIETGGPSSFISNHDGSGLAWMVNETDIDYLSITNPNLTLGDVGTSYNVSFWFKRNGPPDGNAYLTILWNTTTPKYPFGIWIKSDGTPAFDIYDGSNNPSVGSTTNVCDDAWHYISALRNAANSTIAIYVDGNRDGEETDTTTETMAGDTIFIGNTVSSAPTLFNFSISDFTIEPYPPIYRNASTFKLWKYNESGWTLLNDTPDLTENTLSLFNFEIGSDYGILDGEIIENWIISSVNSPTNTTYETNNITFNVSCYGSFTNYLMNLTINDEVNLSDQIVLNDSIFSTSMILNNGIYNVSSTCWNETTTNNSEIIYFTVNQSIISTINFTLDYVSASEYNDYTYSENEITMNNTGTFIVNYLGQGGTQINGLTLAVLLVIPTMLGILAIAFISEKLL
jgi:hypothetical protein